RQIGRGGGRVARYRPRCGRVGGEDAESLVPAQGELDGDGPASLHDVERRRVGNRLEEAREVVEHRHVEAARAGQVRVVRRRRVNRGRADVEEGAGGGTAHDRHTGRATIRGRHRRVVHDQRGGRRIR